MINEEQARARKEAWEKERKDENDLDKCKTIDDFQQFIDTHPDSIFLKDAQTHLEALMAEPKQLTLFLICNIITIVAIVLELIINNMKYIGVTLLISGIVEEIIYKAFGKKWKFYETEGYLVFSAVFLIIIGAIVCFRVFITKP